VQHGGWGVYGFPVKILVRSNLIKINLWAEKLSSKHKVLGSKPRIVWTSFSPGQVLFYYASFGGTAYENSATTMILRWCNMICELSSVILIFLSWVSLYLSINLKKNIFIMLGKGISIKVTARWMKLINCNFSTLLVYLKKQVLTNCVFFLITTLVFSSLGTLLWICFPDISVIDKSVLFF
jgi:hypothetical protein